MSHPKHPIITFTVKLDFRDEKIGPITNEKSVNLLHPDMHVSSPTAGRASRANHLTQVSTFIPGLLGGENVVVNDDGTIVAYGAKAVYLKNTYATGAGALLEVVSVTSESESA